jgi:hypothetical protein
MLLYKIYMTGNNVNYKLIVTMVNELPKLERQVAP